MLTVADLVNEVHDTYPPIGTGLDYKVRSPSPAPELDLGTKS